MFSCHLTCYAAADVQPPQEIKEAAEEIGEVYDIPPYYLEAIAYYESRYQADVSNQWCVGLMQVSQKWHQKRMDRLGVTDLTDAYSNMLVAADYLSELMRTYKDVGMVLMTYNGDKNAKDYYRGEASISDYAKNVMTLAKELESQEKGEG